MRSRPTKVAERYHDIYWNMMTRDMWKPFDMPDSKMSMSVMQMAFMENIMSETPRGEL